MAEALMGLRSRTAVVLGLIVIAGVALRSALLGNGLWRDEAYSYFDVTTPTLGAMFEHIWWTESNPPAFFVLLRGWTELFGVSEVSLKMLPLVWSAGAIAATYALARTCASESTALGAAFLLAVSTPAILFGTDVRPYAMAQCLTAVDVALYVRAISRGDPRSLAAWVVCSIVAVFTQYISILLLAALALATWLFRRALVVSWFTIAFGFCAVALAFVSWMPTFLHHVAAGEPWSRSYGPIGRLGFILAALAWTCPSSTHLPELIGSSASFVVSMMVFVFAVDAVAVRHRRGPSLPDVSAFASPLVATTAILSCVFVSAIGYLQIRYIVPLLPLFVVVYADAFARLLERRPIVGRAVLALLALEALASTAGATGRPESGMRAVAAQARASVRGEVATWLVAPDDAAPTLAYYLRSSPVTLYGVPRWDHPEYFRVGGYLAAWKKPDLIGDALRRVNDLACSGNTRLLFVKRFPLGTKIVDIGGLPTSRAGVLEAALRRRYAVLTEKSYDGVNEPAALVDFRLSCSRFRMKARNGINHAAAGRSRASSTAVPKNPIQRSRRWLRA